MKETMTKRERLEAVLNGELPDRPPMTVYKHHPGKEYKAEDLFNSTLELQKKFDLDIVKIHPAATVLEHIWGSEFDYDNYKDEIFPTKIKREIYGPEDIHKFTVKDMNVESIKEVVKATKLIQEALGEEVPIFQTLFAPIAIVSSSIDAPKVRRHTPASREGSDLIDLIVNRKDDLHQALENITQTFIKYVELLMDTGIDGLFYAGIGYAREGYLTFEEWEEFIKPYDIRICNAIRENGGKIIYHTCGKKSNPERFADYPIDILHWDQGAEGNPKILGSEKWLNGIVPMGGVDEMLFGNDKAEQIEKESIEALIENKNIPHVFAPYCSILPSSSDEEIMAFRNSVNHIE